MADSGIYPIPALEGWPRTALGNERRNLDRRAKDRRRATVGPLTPERRRTGQDRPTR